MPRVTQRERRESALFAPIDPNLHRLGRDGLAVAEPAVDDDHRRRVDNDLGRLIGHDKAHLLPADIDRNPDHTMTVVAGQVRGGEVGGYSAGLLGRGVGMFENVSNEINKAGNLDYDHDNSRVRSNCETRVSMDCHVCDARHLRSTASLLIKLLKSLPSMSIGQG